MEMKNVNIKNIRYEEFKDNEYLEKYVEELHKSGTNVIVGKINDIINWGQVQLCVAIAVCHQLLRD